jgi:hypothetical protein
MTVGGDWPRAESQGAKSINLGTTTGLPTNRLDSYRTIVDGYLSMLDRCRGIWPKGNTSATIPSSPA